MLEDVIKIWGGQEVTAMDVYRDMYHFGEGYLQNENEEKKELESYQKTIFGFYVKREN